MYHSFFPKKICGRKKLITLQATVTLRNQSNSIQQSGVTLRRRLIHALYSYAMLMNLYSCQEGRCLARRACISRLIGIFEFLRTGCASQVGGGDTIWTNAYLRQRQRRRWPSYSRVFRIPCLIIYSESLLFVSGKRAVERLVL